MRYYVGTLPYSDELSHFGIKGQKWGIRRYQNPDGTLTAEGKARYGSVENLNKHRQERKQKIKKGVKVAALTLGTIALATYAHKISLGKTILNLVGDIKLAEITGTTLFGVSTTQDYLVRDAFKDVQKEGKKIVDNILNTTIGGKTTQIGDYGFKTGGTKIKDIFKTK